MSRRWYAIRLVSETAFTIFVTFAALKWGSHIAYAERGYDALGGEYIFAGIAGCIAYRAIDLLFEALEEEIYAAIRRRKRRSRKISRSRGRH